MSHKKFTGDCGYRRKLDRFTVIGSRSRFAMRRIGVKSSAYPLPGNDILEDQDGLDGIIWNPNHGHHRKW
jgi:hypothetical protein